MTLFVIEMGKKYLSFLFMLRIWSDTFSLRVFFSTITKWKHQDDLELFSFLWLSVVMVFSKQVYHLQRQSSSSLSSYDLYHILILQKWPQFLVLSLCPANWGSSKHFLGELSFPDSLSEEMYLKINELHQESNPYLAYFSSAGYFYTFAPLCQGGDTVDILHLVQFKWKINAMSYAYYIAYVYNLKLNLQHQL